MADLSDLAVISRVVGAAVQFVDEYPERGTRELREAVAAFKEIEARPTIKGVCVRCDHPIVRVTHLDGPPRWYHDTVGRERGCRAASFSRLGDWDDTLERTWVATPRKDGHA